LSVSKVISPADKDEADRIWVLDMMRELRSIVEAYPGTVPLEVEYSDGNGLRARLRSRTLTLAVNNTALNDLPSLLGSDAVRLQRGSK